MKQSENNNNNAQKSRITKVFKSIRDAFSFAWANKDKKPKVRSTADDFYVSYLLNLKKDD